MKKLVLVIAMTLIAACFVTPVTASDFTAGGHYRFEAVSQDPGVGDKSQYFDQRFRVAFNWKANDAVSLQLRGDFAETAWGDGYRPDAGSHTIMIDRAWVNLKQGPLSLTLGQQGGAWGLGTLWSDQFQGIQAGIDLKPITLNLLYVKESEGLTATDDDIDTYGASLLYGSDTFSGGLSYATKRDDATDGALNGFSLHFIVPIANLTLSGAGEIFNGDDGLGSDYAGTQFHAALDMAFSKAFKGGLTFIWADSVNAGETQATNISDDGVFKPVDFDGALAYNNGYYLTPAYMASIFDVSGGGNGAMGIVADAQLALSETIVTYFKLGYIEPSETNGVNLDNNLYAVGNIDYAWMPAVTVSAGVAYVKPDYVDNSADDAKVLLTTQVSVSF